MCHREYKFIEKEDIKSLIVKSELTPEAVYKHFMSNTDEYIYVTENEMLVGIVTVSDLQKFYISGGERDYINSRFSYIDDIDFGKAEKLLLKLGNVHEVPVIKDGRFVGVVTNGIHKLEQHWSSIRRATKRLRFGGAEWRKRGILRLFRCVRPTIYVYPSLSEKKLRWSEEDWRKYKERGKYKSARAALNEMAENEQRDFWGEYYSEEYIRSFMEEFDKIKVKLNNGMSKMDDLYGSHFNISNGYRQTNETKERSERKIYFVGPCTIFGAYVSGKQTIEYYLHKTMEAYSEYDYDILNYGLPGPDITSLVDRLATEQLSDDDIIIYLSSHAEGGIDPLWKVMSTEYPNIKIGNDLTEAYNGIDNPAGNIIDTLYHCNHVINKRMADIIFHDIKPGLKPKTIKGADVYHLCRTIISHGILYNITGNSKKSTISPKQMHSARQEQL